MPRTPLEHEEAGWMTDAPISSRAGHLEMVSAVMAGHGLERVAELASAHAGAPVAVIVPRLGVQLASWVSYECYVSQKIAGEEPQTPAEIVAEVPISCRGEQLGAVLMLGPGRPQAPEYLHGAAVAAMTAVAVHEAREESEQRLRGSFFEELRVREDLSADYIVRRAGRLGCDLAAGGVALCATPAGGVPGRLLACISTEHPGLLAEVIDGRVYALLPGTVETARRVAKQASRQGTVGISSYYSDPRDMRRALEEAELVLDVTTSADRDGEGLAEQMAGGTYRLLFRVLVSSPEEVRAFYEETVAPLVRYDEEYRSSDLVGTLETYLGRDCNMNATAQALYAHRHTISYRLERIRELTGLDPLTSDGRERLGLGLKAFQIIKPHAQKRQA